MALPINISEHTEGKGAGFPIMIDAMKDNGNPAPEFTTNDGQLLFMVTLPCHDEMKMWYNRQKGGCFF